MKSKTDILSFTYSSRGRDVDIVEPVLSKLEKDLDITITRKWLYDNFVFDILKYRPKLVIDLKSATKLFSVLLASKRPLITELADKLRLKYPLLPTISPCPTMRLEAIRSIIPISCRRYPKSV